MWSKLKLWLHKCDHCQNYGYTIVIIIENVARQIWSQLKIWQQNHIEDGGKKQQTLQSTTSKHKPTCLQRGLNPNPIMDFTQM
jgi:hypothetical protein